jgi:tetratricopeptide (TPR) repeat protein
MMVQKSGHPTKGQDNWLCISWNELGNAYMMNKSWSEGEDCFHKSIESAQQLPDYKPTDASFPYVNLGLAYWLTGRHDEALKTLLEGIGYREAAYGVDDRESFM